MRFPRAIMAAAVCVVLSAGTPGFAQNPPADPAEGAAPPAPAASPRNMQFGVRFGPSFTSLTGVEPFDPDIVARASEPTMNFGAFAAIDLFGPFSFQPELLFVARGHRVHDRDALPTTTTTGELKPPSADRVVLIRYLEFPILLRLARQANDTTSLYVLGGPAFALTRNAVLRQVADAGKLDELDDLITGSNLSFVVGAGVQHKRWLVDARMTRGMSNVAVDPDPVNVYTNAFSVLLGVAF